MQIDALTLAALADEFAGELRGARVDDVIQPTPHSIALQLWGGGRNRWLFISAHPQLAHLRLTGSKPRKLATEPPPFVMLLRKHLEGARVAAVRQPAWERVVEIGFARGPDVAAGVAQTWLIAEIMGRYSNVILTDAEHVILGALRLATAQTNQYRAILPREPYRTPPPQTRRVGDETLPQIPGMDLTADGLRVVALAALEQARAEAEGPAESTPGSTPEVTPEAVSATADGKASGKAGKGKGAHGKAGARAASKRPRRPSGPPHIASVIAANVLGFGRELGREVAARVTADPEALVDPAAPWEQWEALAAEARTLAALERERVWRPTLVLAPDLTDEADEDTDADDDAAEGEGDAEGEDDIARRAVALTVYEPRQFPPEDTLRPVASVNDALESLFAGAEWRVELDQAKGDLRRILQTQRDRCVRKAQALAEELATQAEAERLRREADTLLAFGAEVEHGAKSVTLPDPYAEGEGATLTISLDPQLSAVENANRRYTRYHKLQRATELLPEQIEANDLELARVEQLLTDLALADVTAEVSQVRAEVAEAGYIKGGAEARRLEKEQRGKRGKAGKAGKGGKPGKAGKPGAAPKALGGTPLRRRVSGDFVALVGKNSRQNEEVTFHQAAPNDLWLHARGAPGSHVILKTAGRPAPEEALREAAALAAWYSQLREAGSVAVDYTEARYVRHMKGGGPGMVIYEREHTLHAPPTDAGEPVK